MDGSTLKVSCVCLYKSVIVSYTIIQSSMCVCVYKISVFVSVFVFASVCLPHKRKGMGNMTMCV